jgi:tRNA nucleotidyltransferase (CCA-adding enzyme)
LHDIGKPSTQTCKDGKFHFYDHQIVGAKMIEEFCRKLVLSSKDTDFIKNVVFNHMDLHFVSNYKKPHAIWKLAQNPVFGTLYRLFNADVRGAINDQDWGTTLVKADEVVAKYVDKPLPSRLVTGNDLDFIEKKHKELFKKILDKTYNRQLDTDSSKEELVKYAHSLYKQWTK